MKKHLLIASMVTTVGFAPLAALAQDRTPSDSATTSGSMKAPSNAGGMTEGRSDSLRNDSASGLAHEPNGKMTPQTNGNDAAVGTSGVNGVPR